MSDKLNSLYYVISQSDMHDISGPYELVEEAKKIAMCNSRNTPNRYHIVVRVVTEFYGKLEITEQEYE